MPTFSSYPANTPSWVDLQTPDPAAAQAFYGSVFGWTTADLGPEAGGYGMFQKDGANIAGVGPTMGEGQPPAWTSYVNVIDAEATVARATIAGGTILLEPMPVMEAGHMALFADPTGAVLGLWQPGQHKGADVANDPDTWCWNELNTRDVAKATSFYTHVFDWEASKAAFDGMEYTEWKNGGATIGGMLEMPAMVPAQVPAHWLVYFAVSDTDATVATAQKLGATVFVAPTDIPPGRFSVLADPAGAMFAVIKINLASATS
ncbi:MAG TPA: VOC family protein [Acidimicrobiales bacterium]|nr:VOC family protein [Acidimicrobiales bacterium]